jgi:nitrate reductase gamma subunit
MMETWLEWARGPIFWFAIAFMVLGLARHVVLTLWALARTYSRAGDQTIPHAQVLKAGKQWLFPVRKLRERPSYGLNTMIFHVAIIVTPLLLGGHIVLIERGMGFAWPAIPNLLADALTLTAIAAACALVVQRAVRIDTRAVGTFRDYAIPLLIAVPFASGFLVMHPRIHPFPYEAVLFAHVMSANLVMVLVPLTKISHCFLMPLSQIVAEMAWHWPRDAGSKLAETLGKENEPI